MRLNFHQKQFTFSGDISQTWENVLSRNVVITLNTVVCNGATYRRSKIRKYFSVERQDDVKAQCNHCSVKLVRGSNLKAFGSRSYLDETSRHVGYKVAALAQRSDEPPAKKSKMALETLPFLHSWR